MTLPLPPFIADYWTLIGEWFPPVLTKSGALPIGIRDSVVGSSGFLEWRRIESLFVQSPIQD
jgi:hypothetical protein